MILIDLGLDQAEIDAERKCGCCDSIYRIADFLPDSGGYFPKPYGYADGCLVHCLGCWLGIGPESDQLEGNVLRELGTHLAVGVHLAIMPVARIVLDDPIEFAGRAIFYPPGAIDLERLNVVPNQIHTTSLAEHCSAISGVDADVIGQHATVAFPVRFDWNPLLRSSHNDHLELIRMLSDAVDRVCFDLIRYRQCEIEPVDILPGRAGQLDSNHMMAGALLYNAARQEGRIIGGAAFTHIVTRGVGLPIESLEEEAFPSNGEVGDIVAQALSLYSGLLEANSPTTKFVQAMSLLEYLAEPTAFMRFQDVKKIVARYVAKTPTEYQKVLDRFKELSGNFDPTSGKETGYRTRLVHIGDRLDRIVPDYDSRRKLFDELDGYIRAMIDHMIHHAHLSFAEYDLIRSAMGRF